MGPIPAGAGRLIPAGAGRPHRAANPRRGLRAHPRWRGADTRINTHTVAGAGSSPLARGGPQEDGPRLVGSGLIPAGAGRTGFGEERDCIWWAHPRWRGADRTAKWQHAFDSGSSPLARGGRAGDVAGPAGAGLIPAGAGRTRTRPTRRGPCGAHPRWRGADVTAAPGKEQAKGSSPLARGGRRHRGRSAGGRGLIPAGAGRTHFDVTIDELMTAHPRWRGADLTDPVEPNGGSGSSPLARGGRTSDHPFEDRCGLIPAGAGRTTCRCSDA